MSSEEIDTTKNLEKISKEINLYYSSNYSQNQNNLPLLIKKINEDFYNQEYEISEMIENEEIKREKFLNDLDFIENEYNKILEINDVIFDKIKICKKNVESYKEGEEGYFKFLKNLQGLENSISEVIQKK